MNTGERIKQARKRAGITQKELGDLVGMSYQQVAQYEKGTRNPKLETLSKIADALNVLSSDLLDGNIFSSDRDIKPEKDPFLNKMDSFRSKLNNTGQDKAIEQVELLTKIPEYQKEPEE